MSLGARFALAAALAMAPALAQHEPAPQGQAAGGAHEVPPTTEEIRREAAAAAHGEPATPEGAKGEHHGMEGWKWANFLLLAAGLGYLVGKNAGPFFATRSRQIRKDMVEADELRREAEARSAGVEAKLARLGAEIEALRREALEQQAAEAQRMEQQIAAEIEKVEHHSAQEIESAEKSARTELKRYAAQLAIELAEQRIRAAITPQTEDALVRSFVADLGRTSS
jgi:F-type H+-transporting ATPase subunit b